MLLLFGLLVGFASALPIEVTNPSPPNSATGITPSASMALTSIINSSNGSTMMGRMWTNATGVFEWSNWVGPFDNTTMNWQIDASSYSTKYWWGVSVNDTWTSINQTWNFTTADYVAPATPSQQLGIMGTAAKFLLGSVLLVIAAAVIFMVIREFFGDKKKKKSDIKSMLMTILTAIIVSTVLIVAAAAVIAF